MAKEIIFLILYWFFFFHKEIINPFRLATAEMLSECFPNMMLAGEYWSKGKLPRDPYWYQDDIIGASMSGICYPPNIILSIIMQKLSLDKAFALYSQVFLLHFLFMSIGGYVLFGGGALGLLGGLLFGYSGYMVKHYPPVLATIAWIPWILATSASGSVILPAIGLLMALLGGYLPLSLYFTYFFIFINPYGAIVGLLLASPFLVRVGMRFRKSMLMKATAQSKMEIGCVPKWKMLNFILPLNLRHYINGVGFWEMSFYMSPVILFSIFNPNMIVILCGFLLFSKRVFRFYSFLCHRIPARWGHMLTIALIYTTINGISRFSLTTQYIGVLVASLCLLENSNLITYWPFTQPWVRPSEAFKEYTGEWPTTQGQIHHIKTGGYQGCFRKMK